MNDLSKSYITTDYKILRKIQRRKYSRLILPIIAIFLALVITYLMSSRDYMYYPLLALTVASFIWYGYIMVSFRTKGRIVEPEPEMMVIPIEGRIKSLRSSEEMHSIRIVKAFLDVIEIRAPVSSGFTREKDSLIIRTGTEPIHYLFHGNGILWFDVSEPTAGQVIGLLIGKGYCTINLPATYQLQVADSQIVFGGETTICPFKPAVF